MSDDVEIITDEQSNNDDYYKRRPNGQFGKGHKGGPGGIRSIELNKKIRLQIQEFLTNKAEELYDLWDQMTPKDRAAMFVHLTKVVVKPDPEEGGDSTVEIRLIEAKSRKNND
jgi:hypothetical protein